MAPALLFALALLAADPAQTAPASASEAPFPTGAPTDDYGLVAWCYGALSAHMALYEQVMPEVTRIEKQWERTPGSSKKELASYEEQRIEGVRAAAQFRRAMEAAEKASVKPIQAEGAAAIKRGASIWGGAKTADKRRLAQEWMSWALPGRCVPTAEALEKRASVLGQALNYNNRPQAEPAAEPEAAPDLGLRGAAAEAPAAPEPEAAPPEPAPEPEAAPAPEPAAPTPEPTAARAEDFIVDADNPQPCPGTLEPTRRDGKPVLLCKVQ